MTFIEKIKNYFRVLKVVKKPTMEEMKSDAKNTLLGMAIIGGLGFIFYMLGLLIESIVGMGVLW